MLFISTQPASLQNPAQSGGNRTTASTLLPGQRSAAPINLLPLQAILYSLTRACSDALGKSVQHFQGEDAWGIGAMPNCLSPADNLEAEARALLCNSLLTGDQITDVTACLKVSADLRTVARSARQAAQIAWLFRQMPNASLCASLVRPVGEAAQMVAVRATDAVEKNDPIAAREAALLFRRVDSARRQAEAELENGFAVHGLSPEMLRMTRAAIWFMAIAGEGMARVAARVAI